MDQRVRIVVLPQVSIEPVNQVRMVMEALVREHRLGQHDYGRKRRECPLCQQER